MRAVLFLRPNDITKRIDPVRSHIARCWFIRMPNVIPHEDTVETIAAASKQTRNYRPPSSISDDLSRTNALVFELPRKLVLIRPHRRDPRTVLVRRLRFRLGNGSRVVGRFAGRRWQNWFRSRRYRLVQRYHRIAPNRLSNLRHA